MMNVITISKIMHHLKILNLYAAVKSYRHNSYDHTLLSNQNSILLSESRNIYENLALEDWLYKNLDFKSKDAFILLLWYNAPSVVIGRHQNPWVECSLDFCKASGISIARRNSGGGTVYHDYGNVNFSFYASRKYYNRKNNLNLIVNSILSKWPIKLSVSGRDDILCDEKYKVSGTASKVGKFATYHHCTVLVDVDVIKLHQALHRDLNCIKSKATASTKAEVINLKTVCRDINVGDVIKTVADNYKLTYHVKEVLSVYPTEERFPGLNKIQENLMSWSWCFGHTPSFTVTKSFPICPSFSMWNSQNLPTSFEINLVCNKGTIECINIVPQLLDIQTFNRLSQYIMGFKFSDKIIDPLEMWVMDSKSKILCNYVKCCITQMIFDVHK